MAVLSTGETIANPTHLQRAQRELRRLQRQACRRVGPNRRTGQRPSHRWRKSQARIARHPTRVANARHDGLHQLTTRLVRDHDTLVIEDLNVAGMVTNPQLARHVADAGMGELARQLEYKTHGSQRRLVVAHRWFPSSKTCSACGVVKAKLRPSTRTFSCDACGLRLDRDLNAARNLAHLVEEAGGTSTESCAGTLNTPAGNPRTTAAPSGVSGSGYRHGTTPPQGGANAA
ncbi:RNA-guided endonuclease InsQ/TnpB family protein [Haloactinospora alba]|uniref:RNA-guided endonuclease InsQ/TnpB family protein n=1 Tax=Haloactinospora alba TaxID=405555 RepID=UPI001B865A96|nr:RNA-guided endonuclease TnpB family protein [Haloactinospora alba]